MDTFASRVAARRWLPLPLVLMCLALIARGQGAEQQQLATYNTRHYTLHTNLQREEAVPFGRHMDSVFAEYARRFEAFGKKKQGPMPLYLFRTQQQYVDFLAAEGINAANTGGMFFIQPSIQGLATWVQGKPVTHTFAVLQHEGFHQFAFHQIGVGLPIWVNEGLAQYFEDGILVGERMYLGLAHGRRIAAIRNALDGGAIIDFDQLLSMSDKEWHEAVASGSPRASLQYDQSWSIVYFLIHAENGKYRGAFERYLKLVSQRRDSAAAFAEAFGSADTRPFRARWEEFAREVKPDAMATAVERMEFLGQALRFLQDRGDRIPESIEGLRAHLQRIGFRATRQEPGRVTTVNASDESLYRFEPPGGKPTWFELLPPEMDGLLPRITAEGLAPQPTLAWRRDSEGQLVQEIVWR